MTECACQVCGHRWNSPILEDDPDTNSLVIKDEACPECGSDNFHVEGIDSHDYNEDDVI